MESRRLGSEARIHGLNDPNLSFRESVKTWEADLNRKRKWEKSLTMYLIIVMIVVFLFYVAMHYAFSLF